MFPYVRNYLTRTDALERMGDVPAQQEATKVAIWKINGTIQSRTAAYARHKAEAYVSQCLTIAKPSKKNRIGCANRS